jgi:DNA invertase Pin-like site-specific DNA recombinase
MSDRAILYARVSTGYKNTEASNLDAQLELCRKHTEQEGYTIVGEHKAKSLSILQDQCYTHLSLPRYLS